jgi:group I intron endonuclease
VKYPTVCGIYAITNIINNKKYIGQSKMCYHRYDAHLRAARRGDEHHLYRVIRKYGEHSFKFEILKECAPNCLDDLERFFIRVYCSWTGEYGYNRTYGGDSVHIKGLHIIRRPVSQDTRKKMSKKYSKRKWWTNGIENSHSEHCPEGFVLGRTGNSNSMKMTGRHFYTNGKEDKLIFDKDVPEGWWKGRTFKWKRPLEANIHLSELFKERYKTKESRTKLATCTGRYWFTNGILNVRAFKCPEGYYPGRMKRG